MNKLPSASATKSGLVTTTTQSFAGDKTVIGALSISPASSHAFLRLNAASGSDSQIDFQEGGSTRWSLFNRGSTDNFELTSTGGSAALVSGTTGAWTLGRSTSLATHQVYGNIDVELGNGTRPTLTLRYESGPSYRTSLGWNGIQFGNNGGNYIVGGRTTSGGSLSFVTNSTADFNHNTGTPPAGTDAGNIGAAGNWTFGPSGYTGTHVFRGNLQVSKSTSGNGLVITESGAGEVEMVLQRTGGTTASWENYIPSGATTINWWNGANRMVLDASGNLAITGSLSQSDARYKTIQGVITNALEDLATLTPVYYTWIDGYGFDERTHMGLLAQEVEMVFPELIGEVDGIKHLNYGNLCSALIAAIKELKARVEALENA